MTAITEEQLARSRLATKNAKSVLKRGDRVRVRRCGGAHPTYTFDHWDGNWALSKSGIYLVPACITKVNDEPVDFTVDTGE